MARGKQTCKILKEIRRQIAEANDIEFITSECQYQGDCLGTCPKCEAEVRYLEQQLERKRRVGKAHRSVWIINWYTYNNTSYFIGRRNTAMP